VGETCLVRTPLSFTGSKRTDGKSGLRCVASGAYFARGHPAFSSAERNCLMRSSVSAGCGKPYSEAVISLSSRWVWDRGQSAPLR
jgi:hypothetical protein